MTYPILFISHSTLDLPIAELLADLMRSALALMAGEIRCTSVDGYRLPVGVQTDDQLRREILASKAFIGLISEASSASTYVLFELGARWGADKSLAPVLSHGTSTALLKGPLAGRHALRCDSEEQLHQLVADIGEVIGRTPQQVGAYRRQLNQLLSYKPGERKIVSSVENSLAGKSALPSLRGKERLSTSLESGDPERHSVSDFFCRITDSEDDYQEVAWKVTVFNKTRSYAQYWVHLVFEDEEGFVLKDNIEISERKVAPNTALTINGRYEYLETAKALETVHVRAVITRET